MENKELDKAYTMGFKVTMKASADLSNRELEMEAQSLYRFQKSHAACARAVAYFQGAREAVLTTLENHGETIANRAEPWFLL